jgi:hypothetical protein
VKDENQSVSAHFLAVTDLDIGDVALMTRAIACVNPACKKLSLAATLHKWPNRKGVERDQVSIALTRWQLLPQSSAVPQPGYIPAPLVEDYYEACKIRDLSPKASATLARRCLQGMIRDFCGIAKGTLDAEIKELKARVNDGRAPAGVTHESVDAIDHVRSVGNIGAHMEKDIDLIVEVEPDEAQALIGLVEMLFSEWYVARHTRQQKLAEIAAIAAEKKAKIAEGKDQNAEKAADDQKS